MAVAPVVTVVVTSLATVVVAPVARLSSVMTVLVEAVAVAAVVVVPEPKARSRSCHHRWVARPVDEWGKVLGVCVPPAVAVLAEAVPVAAVDVVPEAKAPSVAVLAMGASPAAVMVPVADALHAQCHRG